MPSTCIFEFDRPEPVYYSGETINGRIQLHTTSEKSVREIYILFHGEAKVRWEESKTRQRDGKSQHYSEYYRANETYLHTRTNVSDEGVLPPGTHTYTFCIPLPIECPTSCVERYGEIKYELSLVINRPYRFDNIFKQPITLLHQLDLNTQPHLLIPCQDEDVKYFCCWPCSSGPVHSTLTIPFGGYAPGQMIKFKLEIDNESKGYDLEDGIRLKLIQTYKFIAHTPRFKTRHHTNSLARTHLESRCLRLSKRVIEGELAIPSVPPSSQDNGIITVSYSIKMVIDTGCCHTDSEMVIPITVGTVPLAQSATNPANVIAMQPTAPPASGTSSTDSPPHYDLLKPPSFEEATVGDKFVDTDVDEHNRTDFVPKYPMYTNFAVPTAPSAHEGEHNEEPLIQSTSQVTQTPPYPIGDVGIPPPPMAFSEGYGWKA